MMTTTTDAKAGFTERALATVERVGNKLPDPAILFIALLVIVWVLSFVFSWFDWGVTDPVLSERDRANPGRTAIAAAVMPRWPMRT